MTWECPSKWLYAHGAGMSFRLSTLLECSNGGYIDECTTRYHLHRCNVDFTHNDSQNDRTHSQRVWVWGYQPYLNTQMAAILMNALRDMICIDIMKILSAMTLKMIGTTVSTGMSFRLSTLLEYSNGGYIDECPTRYDLHRCYEDFKCNDSQNDPKYGIFKWWIYSWIHYRVWFALM